jgi:hypothetical protein
MGVQPEDSIYTYPSLRDFENVTELNIEFHRLRSLRHLPESLKHLTLVFCHFEAVDDAYLSDLYGLKDTWCPAIQTVVVSGYGKAVPGHFISQVWSDVISRKGTLAEYSASACLRLENRRFHSSEDGRSLTLLGAGYDLLMKSHEPDLYDAEDDEEFV